MERKVHFNFWYFVVALFAVMMLQQWLGQYQQVETIPYSAFQAELRAGNVEEVSVADDYVRGKLREPPPDGRQYIFTVRVDPELARDLEKYGVTYTGIIENNIIAKLLSWIVPVVVFFALWMYVFRRMAERGGMGETLGQAIYVEDQPRFLEGVIRPPGMGGIYSQETAREIDVAVRALIDSAHARATQILSHHRELLDDTARRLLAQETLSEDELPTLPPELGASTEAAQ